MPFHHVFGNDVVQVNNVIDPFKYTEVPFGTKGELKEYLKVCGIGSSPPEC